MRLTGGFVYDPVRGFVERDVSFLAGVLCADDGGETADVSGCYVIPGLTDLHFHGACGADVSDGDADGLRVIAEYEVRRGVTQICPAVMTLETDALRAACETAAKYRRTAVSGAELVGLNLEGPFLSPAKKGAQNDVWMRNPDLALLRELNACSGGLVRLVTIAPELPGSQELIAGVPAGITVSVGHTTADYDTALAAFRAGARQATHLYNAMPPFSHREPGVIGAALDSPQVRAELISDGIHIHPSVVRAVFRMFGKDRVILVSDTMRAVGLKDGGYTLGGLDVTVRGRTARLADGTIAGSVTDLMDCLRSAVSFGIPLADAVTAAARNPAEAIGIGGTYGTLDDGKAANLVVLNRDLSIHSVYLRGERISQEAL